MGDEVSDGDLERLRAVDGLLRTVPAPPSDVPARVHRAVEEATEPRVVVLTRRRTFAAVALAAALAAACFGIGTRVSSGDDFDARATLRMIPTSDARGASAVIEMGKGDGKGNWPVRFRADGLKRLPAGGYYVLWLAKDGEYAGTCGTFRVGSQPTTVRMNASYELGEYDRWVVSAFRPDRPDAEEPWLLEAPINRA